MSTLPFRMSDPICFRAPLQVVAEWELFMLTSVSYAASVRKQKRDQLYAIQADERVYLNTLHASITSHLHQLDAATLSAVVAPVWTLPRAPVIEAEPLTQHLPPAALTVLAHVNDLTLNGRACEAMRVLNATVPVAQSNGATSDTVTGKRACANNG